MKIVDLTWLKTQPNIFNGPPSYERKSCRLFAVTCINLFLSKLKTTRRERKKRLKKMKKQTNIRTRGSDKKNNGFELWLYLTRFIKWFVCNLFFLAFYHHCSFFCLNRKKYFFWCCTKMMFFDVDCPYTNVFRVDTFWISNYTEFIFVFGFIIKPNLLNWWFICPFF